MLLVVVCEKENFDVKENSQLLNANFPKVEEPEILGKKIKQELDYDCDCSVQIIEMWDENFNPLVTGDLPYDIKLVAHETGTGGVSFPVMTELLNPELFESMAFG